MKLKQKLQTGWIALHLVLLALPIFLPSTPNFDLMNYSLTIIPLLSMPFNLIPGTIYF